MNTPVFSEIMDYLKESHSIYTMKQYILYFVIIVLLVYFAYNLYQHREGIQNKVTHIVLLGDSIFQNNNYKKASLLNIY